MDNTPPPFEGLRRSKRNNKYHLNVASLLLSSSSTIRRDVSPPTPEKSQPQLKRREKTTKLLTPAASNTMNNDASMTTAVINIRGLSTTASSSASTTTAAARNTKMGMDISASNSATVIATKERGYSVTTYSNNEVEELADAATVKTTIRKSLATIPMTSNAEERQLKEMSTQLPDQILEEEDSYDGKMRQCNTTAAVDDGLQLRLRRKRKVPLKHRDYFNDVEAEDNEDDDDEEFEEQMQLKAVKVEYMAPEDTKLDDHSCPRCPAIFDSRVGLTNHLKLHGSNKEFPCELCDFSCTNKKTMRQHRRVHGLSRRPRSNNTMASTNTSVVVKGELRSAAAAPPLKWAETYGVKSSTTSTQWATQCSINLDKLAQGSCKEMVTTTKPTTVFKPISSNNIYANKICSTVADVAKLVTQMYHQQLQNQRKAEEENERTSQNKTGGTKQRDKGEEEEREDGAGDMPVLEQQQLTVDELQPLNTKNGSRNNNQPPQQQGDINEKMCSLSVRKDFSFTSSAGCAGKAVYDRNTIQCPHCPFRTQSKQRLQPHLKGHTRTYGYQCSVCGFKSDSSGFLRRHNQLHGDQCKWPPDYVGVPNNERILAKLLEPRYPTTSSPKTNAKNDVHEEIIVTSSPLFDGCDVAKNQPHQYKEDTREASVVNNTALHRLIKMEMNEFNEDEHDQIVAYDTYINASRPSTTEGSSAATPTITSKKFCWTRKMIMDRWCAYQNHGLRFRSMCASIANPPCLFCCRRCQLLCHSNPAHLALHNARHHHITRGTNQRSLFRELLAERLAWRDDRGDGIEFEFTTRLSKEYDDCRTPSPLPADASSGSVQLAPNIGTPVGKLYRCRNCPFSTDQIFRLQKHENKHLFKSEHQCSNCSFSCRSLDILAQHKRLHEDAEQCLSKPNKSPPLELLQSSSHQQLTLSSARLAPIRRNEAHYCPHCPYSSKHNCDMKAHMRMHEVRSKFSCSLCTYSTKRQNALIAHGQLHRTGPLLGSPAVLGPRGAKCHRLKRIILLPYNRRRYSLGASLTIGVRIRFEGARTHFYRCAIQQCGEEVPFCADLVRHARNHRARTAASLATGTITASLFQCGHCTFVTSLEHRLKAHQLLTHNRHAVGDESCEEKNLRTDAGIFNCKECPFTTVNYAKFWNHRQKHKRKNRFTCTHCSFSSGSVQCYTEHIALHEYNNNDQELSSSACSPFIILTKQQIKEPGNLTLATQIGAVQTTEMSSDEIAQTEQLCRSPIFHQDKFYQFDAALPPYAHTKLMLGGMDGGGSSSSSDSSSTSAPPSSLTISKTLCCTECPFETVHTVLFKLHQEMHRNGMCRPFTCALCTFGCFSAESLHAHLALHASATALEGCGNVSDGGAPPQTDTMGQETSGHFSMVNNNVLSANVISSPSTVYACSQCSFKSTELELFVNHRKEHVQLIQQRLMTIIKRAAVMDNLNSNCIGNGATKMEKVSKSICNGGGRTADKQHYCTRCSFRCDSVQAFTRHWEHHCIDNCRPGIFKCNACDYSSDTRNVVLFHQHNHHLDIPLTSLCKNIELVKEQQQLSADDKSKAITCK